MWAVQGGPQRSLTIVPGRRSCWRPRCGCEPCCRAGPWPRGGPDPGWPTVGQLPPLWEPLPVSQVGSSALWGQSPALTATLCFLPFSQFPKDSANFPLTARVLYINLRCRTFCENPLSKAGLPCKASHCMLILPNSKGFKRFQWALET